MTIRVLAVALLAVTLACTGGCATTQASKAQREKQAQVHFQLGVDALRKGLLPKAFEELMLADRLQPNRPETLDALAYAWRLRGDTAKAEGLYKRALRLQDRPETHNNYANLLIELKRYDEAARQARLALDDPRYRNQHLALMNLGDAMLALGKVDEALKSYEQAALLRPEDEQPILKEAHAYVVLGQPHYAIALLKSALRKHPASRELTAALVELLLPRDPALARAYLAQFRNQATNDLDRAWAADKLDKLP